jgi:pimeloyl-ACP methyl ester carboxylesterase
MKEKLTFALLFILSFVLCIGAQEPIVPNYFDTAFLANPSRVIRALKEENFNDVHFASTDGLRLEGLYLKRPDARYNVICCAGWWPGLKEGIATFYKLLPQDCNILFFDARGHGKSQGSYVQVKYGLHDYKDIIGALEFIQKDTGKPTLLYGICAGAFNAAHAIIELQKQNRLETLSVLGLIFDSGWVSVDKTAYSVARAKTNEILMKKIASWYVMPHYQDAKKTTLFSCFSAVTRLLLGGVHMVLSPILKHYESETNLLFKAQKTPIQVPCLFIHSHDDTSVSLTEVQKFAAYTPHKTCWWIDKSSKHACHHLKHKDAYQKYLDNFIKSVVSGRQYESKQSIITQ